MSTDTDLADLSVVQEFFAQAANSLSSVLDSAEEALAARTAAEDALNEVQTDLAEAVAVADSLMEEINVISFELIETRARLDTALRRIAELEASPSQPPVSLKPRVPVTGCYLGSSFGTRTGETKAQALARTEAHFGRKLDITHYFITGENWMPDFEEDVRAGRMPHISTKIASWDAVASGSADAAIKRFAARVKALNGPCFITYWHEPTNEGSGTPATYVAAWRRFRQIMDGEGVQNAAYVWVMIAYDLRTTFDADAWFPGKDVIDWVGADPYNWAPVRANSTWTDFSRVVQHAVAYAKKVGLPLFIAETGTNEDPAVPGRKAQWFNNLLAYLKADPTIKALLYFNNTHANTSNGVTTTNHWQVDSTQSALSAWRTVAADPHFRPTF